MTSRSQRAPQSLALHIRTGTATLVTCLLFRFLLHLSSSDLPSLLSVLAVGVIQSGCMVQDLLGDVSAIGMDTEAPTQIWYKLPLNLSSRVSHLAGAL